MNRILLVLALFIACGLVACQKSSLYGSVQYKAQAKIDDSIVSKYIKTNHLTGIAKHVEGNDTIGVYYIILTPGTGNSLYTNSTQVTVGDTCRWISSGTLVGNGPLVSQTNNFHPTYPLGEVILGWQLGIPMGNVGGEVRLLVPSRYAYGRFPHAELNGFDLNGKNGEPTGLPANAVLDFRIMLYDVTN